MNTQAEDFINKIESKNSFKLNNTIQKAEIMFGSRPGFTLIEADVEFENKKVPGAVFISGDAVAIFTVLITDKDSYVVLTKQPRFPTGDATFFEIPAGMTDGDGNIQSKALIELEEETGLLVKKDDLLLTEAFYTSPGRCDEKIWLYQLELHVDETLVDKMHQFRTGNQHENENIILEIVPMNNVFEKIKSDAKSLIGYFKYQSAYTGD